MPAVPLQGLVHLFVCWFRGGAFLMGGARATGLGKLGLIVPMWLFTIAIVHQGLDHCLFACLLGGAILSIMMCTQAWLVELDVPHVFGHWFGGALKTADVFTHLVLKYFFNKQIHSILGFFPFLNFQLFSVWPILGHFGVL